MQSPQSRANVAMQIGSLMIANAELSADNLTLQSRVAQLEAENAELKAPKPEEPPPAQT